MGFVHALLRVAVVASSAFLFALLLGLTLLLSLSDAQIGAGATTVIGVENYSAALRSFDFRRSLVNTLWVTGLALIIVMLAAGTVQRFLTQGRWLRSLIVLVVLVPVAMSGVLGVQAWRDVLELLQIPLEKRSVALTAFAVVQAWRALPLALAVRNAPVQMGPRLRVGLAGAVAGCRIVLDVSVVLLLTGGAPYNATHVLASWSYVTAVTSGQIGLGAAMATVLLASVLVMAGVLGLGPAWFGMRLSRRAESGTAPGAEAQETPGVPAPVPAGRVPGAVYSVALALILAWLLLPLVVAIGRAGWPWQWGPALDALGRSGYVGWLGSTLLAVIAAAVVAVWVAPSLALRLQRRAPHVRRTIGFGIPALAGASLAVAYVPLLWLADRFPVWPNTLGLTLLYICLPLCVSVGFSVALRSQARLNSGGLTAVPALVALFIVTQDVSNALALDVGVPQTFNSGLVNNLTFRVDVAPSTTALAVVLPSLLFGALYVALVWIIHKRRAGDGASVCGLGREA